MKSYSRLTLLVAGMFWAAFVYSQPIVKVAGAKDAQAIKSQIIQYLDHLQVKENIYLSVFISPVMPQGLMGLTLCNPVIEPHGYLVIMVRIDAHQKEEQQRLILAHEMIHVKQYAKGELRFISKNQVRWKGKRYYHGHTYQRYYPWEREAYQKDAWLAGLYGLTPEVPLAVKTQGVSANKK